MNDDHDKPTPIPHPALWLIGMVDVAGETGAVDVAREHDRVLARDEESSWPAESIAGHKTIFD